MMGWTSTSERALARLLETSRKTAGLTRDGTRPVLLLETGTSSARAEQVRRPMFVEHGRRCVVHEWMQGGQMGGGWPRLMVEAMFGVLL